MEEKILLVFKTTRDVIVSERECKKAGFDCLAVPIPREHSSQCGIALEVPYEQKEKVFELLNGIRKQFKYYDKNEASKRSGRVCKVN
jgi:hypothetical protein